MGEMYGILHLLKDMWHDGVQAHATLG